MSRRNGGLHKKNQQPRCCVLRPQRGSIHPWRVILLREVPVRIEYHGSRKASISLRAGRVISRKNKSAHLLTTEGGGAIEKADMGTNPYQLFYCPLETEPEATGGFMRVTGLEPALLTKSDPKSDASANSAIPAEWHPILTVCYYTSDFRFCQVQKRVFFVLVHWGARIGNFSLCIGGHL